jgi:TP901 family phage tail tape measure protein
MASLDPIGVSVVITSDNAGIEESQAALDEYKESIDSTAAQFDAANDSMVDNMTETTAAINDQYAARADAAKASAVETDASSAASDFGNGAAGAVGAGGIASKLSSPYVLAGALIAGAFYESIKAAGNFQQQLTTLYNTAGETMPLQQLSSDIKNVAIETGESTTDLTSALYYISSAGFTAANGIKVLTAASEGAREENADLTTVANALTTVLHDYGAGASQSTKYMDELITGTSLGKMTLQDFTSSLSTVLPIAAKVGLSFSQVAAAQATLTEGGVTAQHATQDLAALIRTMEAPTTQQTTAFQQMGLSAIGLQKEMGSQGLTATVDTLFTAVASHSKDGQVIQSTFQNATQANKDLNTEMASMPPQLKTVTDKLLDGTITYKDYRRATQSMPEALTNIAKGFETTYNKAHTFNQQLLDGVNASPSVLNELKLLTGQSNSLNGVLMLTGANQAVFDANNKKIEKSGQHAGSSVQGWGLQQKTMNQQMAEFKERIDVVAVTLGTKLMPFVLDALKDLEHFANAIADVVGFLERVDSAMHKLESHSAIFKDFVNIAKGGAITTDLSRLIPGFASGTNYAPGGLSLVGENGPELVNLPQGAQVIPNSQSSSMLNSNNSSSVSIGQVVLASASAVQEFFSQVDRDSQLTSMGLSPARGIA